ncbi:monocarboxylate transporter 13-like [Amphiura filiformis]|uniref:monocarboxylate transporter 13-like n=1 Tax=Amphiura filiformis TaxID=82378 RepID=UPI003B21938F
MSSTSTHQNVDKGWAWMVVGSAFFSRLLHEGIFKSLGVLLPTLSVYFDVPVWVIGNTISFMAVIGGVQAAIPYLRKLGLGSSAIFQDDNARSQRARLINDYTHRNCILTSSLGKSLPPRLVVMVGGILTGAGLILSSFSNSWSLISLYLILMTGVGIRYIVVVLMGVLGVYFDKHFSTATSIAISGTCVGVMIFAPITQLFLDLYGWRGALFLLGAISFNLLSCGVLLKHQHQDQKSYEPLENCGNEAIQQSEDTTTTKCSLFCYKLRKYLEYCEPLFKDSLFLVWLSTNCLLEYTWAGWLIYLVPHAEDKGLSPYQATSLATSGGIGFLFGLFPTGYIVDKRIPHFGSNEIRALALLLGGIALLIDPLCGSMVILSLLSILFGAAIGSLKVTSFSTAKDIEGDLTQVLSWSFTFIALAKVGSGFLTGWLYEYTQRYDVSFAVLGSVMLFGSLIQTLYVVCTWKQD